MQLPTSPKGDNGNLIKELGENASEVLKTFSKIFLISCGSNLLESVREEIEKKKRTKKASYKAIDSVRERAEIR